MTKLEVMERDCMQCENTFTTTYEENADYCKNCRLPHTKRLEDTEVTKEQFEAYRAVQKSGVTNMWAVNLVSKLSGLDEETILAIMKDYADLEKKYCSAK